MIYINSNIKITNWASAMNQHLSPLGALRDIITAQAFTKINEDVRSHHRRLFSKRQRFDLGSIVVYTIINFGHFL